MPTLQNRSNLPYNSVHTIQCVSTQTSICAKRKWPNHRAKRKQSPSPCEEMAEEWKFDGHVLPSLPCKCTEAYKQPDPLFTRYRPKKEQRLLYQKPCLTRQNVWLMPFMMPQISQCFLHMYTLNSCHFFLYLLWIFKKCYQSTCFTIFLLSFSTSQRVSEAWTHPGAH